MLLHQTAIIFIIITLACVLQNSKENPSLLLFPPKVRFYNAHVPNRFLAIRGQSLYHIHLFITPTTILATTMLCRILTQFFFFNF